MNDSITEDYLAVANPGLNVDLVETEDRNFTCSLCSLADQQSAYCDHFTGHAAPLVESLCDFKELLSPCCDMLSSQYIFWSDFGLEELCSGPFTPLGTDMKECNGMCSDQGTEEIYDNTLHVDWIHELDYI